MQLHKDQVAVVTGAASGIGLGIATEFARRGMHVVMADIEPSTLHDAVTSLEHLPGWRIAVPCDVAEFEQVETLAAAALRRFGTVDVLCNNAGVNTKLKPTWEMDETDWNWVIGVNLIGVINGVRAFVPRFVERRTGYVVNTASLAGVTVRGNRTPYTITKHAVVALTQSMRAEFSERQLNIGTSVLCPAYVATQMVNADRNRPGGQPVHPGLELDRSQLAAVSADDIGRLVAHAIETNRLHVFSHPESGPKVREWIRLLLSDLPR